MFSFGNPFVHDFVRRPKSSYGSFFDNDDFMSLPFSSSNNYYQNEEPSLFRSSSFRQPTLNRSFYQPTYQQQHTSDNEENNDYEFDPFSDFFNLRKRPSKCDLNNNKKIEIENDDERKIENVNNGNSKSIESNLKTDNVSKLKSNVKQPKNLSELRQLKQLKSSSISHQNKELDALRTDTDNEITYKFNYKCNNPSNISVCIRKDGYIELKTIDDYKWLQRIPDNVEIEQASCTFQNNHLSLKLPIKKSTSQNNVQENHNKINDKKDDNNNALNQLQNNQQQLKDNNALNQSQDNSQQSKDEEFDKDAPIVTDIYEDDDDDC